MGCIIGLDVNSTPANEHPAYVFLVIPNGCYEGDVPRLSVWGRQNKKYWNGTPAPSARLMAANSSATGDAAEKSLLGKPAHACPALVQ